MKNPFEKSKEPENSQSAEEQEAFERRTTLRRGGPEADKIREEDKQKDLAEAKERDSQRNSEYVRDWPQKRKMMEEQIKKDEERIQKLENQAKGLEESRKKNDERQFAMQSRTGDSPHDEQRRALETLRSMRDMDARNIELVQNEKKGAEEKLVLLRGELKSKDQQFESLKEAGF